MLNLILSLITGLYQNEPMALYLLHTVATQGSKVSDQETQLLADQEGNGRLCPTCAKIKVRYYIYTSISNDVIGNSLRH